MPSELKQIQITGGAKEDYESLMHSGRKAKRTRKNRKEDEGPTQILKGGTSPGTLVGLAASHTETTPGTPPPVGVETTGLKTYPSGPAPVQQAGTKKEGPKPKVVLEPAKKEHASQKQLPKVQLSAPKAKHSGSASQTRKARKIRVSLSNLGKRMTRHKSIQKEAKIVPIETVKKSLVEAKLIKADSKAPESMLRQIYADYQTLKNKAL